MSLHMFIPFIPVDQVKGSLDGEGSPSQRNSTDQDSDPTNTQPSLTLSSIGGSAVGVRVGKRGASKSASASRLSIGSSAVSLQEQQEALMVRWTEGG